MTNHNGLTEKIKKFINLGEYCLDNCHISFETLGEFNCSGENMKTQISLFVAATLGAIALASCASAYPEVKFVKPNATQADYDQDMTVCVNQFHAYNTYNGAMAAMIVDGMAGSPRFSECMASLGWTKLDAEALDPNKPRFGFELGKDLFLVMVHPNSPAQKVGLEMCDRLIGLNGTTILYLEDYYEAVLPGQTANNFTFNRKGEVLEITMTPEVLTETADPAEVQLSFEQANELCKNS